MREENPISTVSWAIAGLAAGLGIPTLIAYFAGWLAPILK